MYCAICKKLMIGVKPVIDEHGFAWPYDVQLCEDCRPKDVLTEDELINILKDK